VKIASYTAISELNVQLGSIFKALAFPNKKLPSVIKIQIENSIKSNASDKLAAEIERENRLLERAVRPRHQGLPGPRPGHGELDGRRKGDERHEDQLPYHSSHIRHLRGCCSCCHAESSHRTHRPAVGQREEEKGSRCVQGENQGHGRHIL